MDVWPSIASSAWVSDCGVIVKETASEVWPNTEERMGRARVGERKREKQRGRVVEA